MTVPTDDLGTVSSIYPELERIGYDRAYSFEAKHDPFLPLAVAAEHTSRIQLGTAVAIAFARSPMTLANTGWDLQTISGGRFLLGLGSQIRPHVEERFGMTWSRPAARMAELVEAVRAIWESWETGAKLDFRGDFYQHTRMIPAFDPGPNPHGPPPIFTAGVNRRMTEVAGEVADGFFVHPVNTRRSLTELTVPAIEAGARRAGRDPRSIEIVCVTIVVTGRTEEELRRSREAVRQQLAFYGSTPAYRAVFELHGRGELQPLLAREARAGRWEQMADHIDDEFLEQVAVIGEPSTIAPALKARLEGITDSVSLVNNRAPDPEHFARVVEALRD